MNNMLNDFGLFIDNLRKSRNMSRENFINGIISIRQYQRYVNGEASLNNQKLFQLIDRLGMNFFNIHKLYLDRNDEQASKLDNIYNEILKDNLKQASKLLEVVSIEDFNDKYNKSFYKLCKLLLHKRTKTMPLPMVVTKLKELIDYPSCLNNKIINFVEYVSFIEISSYSSEKYEDVRILNFLYDKIKSGSVSTDSILLTYLPSTYAHVSRKLGVMEEYEKALIIAQKGINWCITNETHNSLVHLFFYKAISLRHLNRNEEALKSAKRMFSLLDVENKEHKTNVFSKLFEKTFNMKVSEL